MQSSWAWMATLTQLTLLLWLLSPLPRRRPSRTSTKSVCMASAPPPAMEARSIAAWSVGLRAERTPVRRKSLTASPSACRGHTASRPATCSHALLSTASPASAWYVTSYRRTQRMGRGPRPNENKLAEYLSCKAQEKPQHKHMTQCTLLLYFHTLQE